MADMPIHFDSWQHDRPRAWLRSRAGRTGVGGRGQGVACMDCACWPRLDDFMQADVFQEEEVVLESWPPQKAS